MFCHILAISSIVVYSTKGSWFLSWSLKSKLDVFFFVVGESDVEAPMFSQIFRVSPDVPGHVQRPWHPPFRSAKRRPSPGQPPWRQPSPGGKNKALRNHISTFHWDHEMVVFKMNGGWDYIYIEREIYIYIYIYVCVCICLSIYLFHSIHDPSMLSVVC